MFNVEFRRTIVSGIFTILSITVYAQMPVMENVVFEQRTDGSLLVDIYYDVTTAGGLPLEVVLEASDDNGQTWDLTCTSLSGDIGEYLSAGEDKHVIWDFYTDNPGINGGDFKVRITAECMICGQTITEDLTLTRDIICNGWDYEMGSGYLFMISTDDVTLDLNGHSISSNSLNPGAAAIWVEGADRVSIKNGIVDHGFSWGIALGNSDSVSIEDMIIRDLTFANGDTFVMGIGAGDSHDILVRDCQFNYLPVHHKEAVVMGNNTSFTVDNIEVIGGSVGVNISGDDIPSTGTVTNSRFVGGRISGVLVHATTNAHVAYNTFEEGGGVNTDYVFSEISGLVIEENDILNGGGYDGISLRGSGNVSIFNNNIRNNNRGIILIPSTGCLPGSELGEVECTYSTANVIRGNVVLGNDIDLYHHEKCFGNTWEDNTYETAEGSDFYTIGTVSAKQFLAAVDSVAKTVISDAQLYFVTPWGCDTTGTSIRWIYLYRSESQHMNYEFWVNDGKVITRDHLSIPWMDNFDHEPYTQDWIDSDSAVSIAEEMGGRTFRQSYELLNIEMGLNNLLWGIHYVSEDSITSYNIDALLTE